MVLLRFRLARHRRPAARFRADARPEFVRLLLRRRPVQGRFEPSRDGRRFAQLCGEGLRPFFERLDSLREDEQVAGEGERLHVDLGLIILVGPLAGFRLAAFAAGQAGQLEVPADDGQFLLRDSRRSDIQAHFAVALWTRSSRLCQLFVFTLQIRKSRPTLIFLRCVKSERNHEQKTILAASSDSKD